MKVNHLIAATLVAASLITSASAFDINLSVEASANLVTKTDGTGLSAGEFTLRLGYFNFNSNYGLNNAAIAANANNPVALNAAWVNYFTFDAAQQAQGDQATFGDVNGEAGPNAGLLAGNNYAYLTQDSSTYSASFGGKNMYAWYTLNINPLSQLIAADDDIKFVPNNDPLNSGAGLTLDESILTLDILVGNDRTATANNDYQLTAVPEPSSILMLLGGLGGLGIVAMRRRKA